MTCKPNIPATTDGNLDICDTLSRLGLALPHSCPESVTRYRTAQLWSESELAKRNGVRHLSPGFSPSVAGNRPSLGLAAPSVSFAPFVDRPPSHEPC